MLFRSLLYTTGFGVRTDAATIVLHGSIVLNLVDASTFKWAVFGGVGLSAPAACVYIPAGSKTLSAALDRVRITTVNGTDTFDAGSINIAYE